MKKSKLKNNSGFSLVEILVSTSILLLVFAMGQSFIVQGFRATTFDREQSEAIRTGRKAMGTICKQIRGANSSEQGDYPLIRVEEQDIIFFSDVDDDGLMEKIRYFRDDDTLVKTITEPGPLNNYAEAPATTTLSLYLNNQEEPIFNYFDSDSAATTVINDIRLININLRINVTPWRAPNDYYLESDVTFRNLKSNL